ncbi:hypothetical protein ACI3L3_08735 [Desulfobaculum sp. SPO524]|uniref:hypothetical protein n=1 Tax=Desulfobaculum sp. SPO524 TaxID=3378071 RepID=UPI0038533F88
MHDRTTMLDTIIEMNRKSAVLYDRASAACSDPLGSMMFAFLHREKETSVWRAHVAKLSLRGELWTAAPDPVGGGVPPRVLFRRLAARTEPAPPPLEREQESVELALDMEKAVVGYYSGQFEAAAQDEERRFIETMIASGQEVILLLTDLQYYFSDPHGWVKAAETEGMDTA